MDHGFIRTLQWGSKMCFYFYLGIFSASFCWLVLIGLNAYAIYGIIKLGFNHIPVALIAVILSNMLAITLALSTSRTVYYFLGRYCIFEEGIAVKYPLQRLHMYSWDRIVKMDTCDMLLGPVRKPVIRCSLTYYRCDSDLQTLEAYLFNSKKVLVFAYDESRYIGMQNLWCKGQTS